MYFLYLWDEMASMCVRANKSTHIKYIFIACLDATHSVIVYVSAIEYKFHVCICPENTQHGLNRNVIIFVLEHFELLFFDMSTCVLLYHMISATDSLWGKSQYFC